MDKTTLGLVKITNPQFKEVKKNLINKKQALIEELKTKHQAVYDWLVENNIDLDNLSKYTKNIAAALLVTINQINATLPQATPVPPVTPPAPIKTSLAIDESKYEAKARHIWELYGNMINAIAQKHNIDPQLIFATIMTESGGNPYAYRFEPRIGDASYGLGQILYGTALGLGFRGRPQDMYQPIISIDLVGRYHKRTKERYGDLTPEQMSIVYNTGSLFKRPHPEHLDRFKIWYDAYPVKKELASAQKLDVQ